MRHRKEASRRQGGATVASTEIATPPASAAGEAPPVGVSLDAKDREKATTGSAERCIEAALGALVMGVYLKTLYPSVAGGDSGELVAESCHLGVSHPPGYPLFNMLVYLVTTYLPTDKSKAWKANTFSAACDTLAAVVMYHTLLLWTSANGSRWHRMTAAFTASALFAFSPLIWTYAVGAEVFALNNLFAALLVYTLLQYSIDRSLRLALRGALLCGLAMCNQHTIILFEIPIVLWVLWTRRATLFYRELALLALAFFAGLVPYAYMPITAIWNAQPGSWGDVTTLTGFIHHLRRADYGTFRLFSTNKATEDIWTRLHLYGVDLSSREAPFHLAIPLAATGLLASWSMGYVPQLRRDSAQDFRGGLRRDSTQQPRSNAFGRLIAALYGFYMVVFHALANLPLNEGLLYGVHMRFWQQPNVVVFLWVGLGINTVLEVVSCATKSHGAASAVLRCIPLGLVAYQLAQWYELCDQSQAFYIRNYAAALLDPLPANALLFVNFDLQWTALRYLQRCEQRRPDVTVINYSMMTYRWFESKHNLYPDLTFPGARLVPYGSKDGFSFAQFLDSNEALMARPRHGGIFFGGKMNYDDPDFRSAYAFIPFALLDEIQPAAKAVLPLKTWYPHQERARRVVRERLPELPPARKYNDETWEWTIARDVGMKQLSWSTYLLERTIAEDPHNLQLLSKSTHAMEHSYQFEPSEFWNRGSNLKNLGLAYAQIVKSNQAFAGADDPFLNDAVGRNVLDQTKYKDRASARMLEVWDAWLKVPQARNDPGYAAIRGVIRKFLPESVGKSTFASSGKSKKKKSKKSKKKKRPTTRSSDVES